jgi:hypothetical protein
MSVTADARVRTALAVVALGRCVVCGRAPAGSSALLALSDDEPRLVAYGLCRFCHRDEHWPLHAELAIFGSSGP